MREAIDRVGMKPPHPGAFIRTEILEELGLTVTKAAEVLGVGRQALSDLVNTHHSLSPEMAFRIEKAFGLDMETLLRMQAWYDTSRMRERGDDIKVEPYKPV